MTPASLVAGMQIATGLSRDALHIYAALFVQILVAAAIRRSLAHPLPWTFALIVALAEQWSSAGHAPWARMLASTMAIPTLLLILARFAPALLRPRAERSPEVIDKNS